MIKGGFVVGATDGRNQQQHCGVKSVVAEGACPLSPNSVSIFSELLSAGSSPSSFLTRSLMNLGYIIRLFLDLHKVCDLNHAPGAIQHLVGWVWVEHLAHWIFEGSSSG